VDGFDLSEPMPARCRERCAERGLAPRLWRAGFADFEPPRLYAGITVPVGSFLFAGDHAEASAVLRRFHDALRPGGLLLIDLPPLSFLTDSMAAVRTWTATNGDLLRMTSRDVAVDWIAQTRTTHDVYERFRHGRLVETELGSCATAPGRRRSCRRLSRRPDTPTFS
jgi:SAM-dependent methyltransferase